MPKYSRLMICCVALVFCSYGCSDDGNVASVPENPKLNLGDACESSELCPEGSVCANGVCTDESDPCALLKCDGECKDGKCVEEVNTCGGKKCTDKQKCQNNVCVDLCGGEICTEGFTCIQNHCTEELTGEPCGDTTCTDEQYCVNEICHETGDCGGITCTDEEVCYHDACHVQGDCGGLTCTEDEACFKDECRFLGDCDGVTCNDDETCYFDGCRPIGDCGGAICYDNEYCFQNSFCQEKVKCGDVYCDINFECIEETCQPSSTCSETGIEKCGESCCSLDEFCGKRSTCCSKENACGQDCCQSGEVCENEVCHIACDENIVRCKLTDGSEKCCAAGEICVSHQCFTPTTSCVDNYMCENGQYCDPENKQCLPQPTGEVCMATPKGGAVQPTDQWYWGKGELAPKEDEFAEYVNVMSAPMVADINNDTIPEVVFNSWKPGTYVGGGILRIIRGTDGKMLAFSDGKPMTDGGSQVAVGKLYPKDKYPEQKINGIDVSGLQIVTCVLNGTDITKHFRIAAYNHEAKLIWIHDSDYNECGQSGPGIADFNNDGIPEVYSRYNVYNGQTGEMIARVSAGDSAYWHQPFDYSVAADLNGDGILELVGGNVAYNVDFANHALVELYNRSADHIDGYPAIGDLDLDGKPEIFVVRANNSTVMAFKNDGSDFWPAPVAHDAEAGGPPTIANLDSTPNPELTFAGKKAYLALDYQGKILWRRTTHDYTSAKTGSSVFDFDGDGKADVVYNDEFFLRVYDGETGNTKYCKCNTSGTHWEYPVIVDVNNDGHAEIVVCSNPFGDGNRCPTSLSDAEGGDDPCVQELMAKGGDDLQGAPGVRVFASPDRDWVNTRKIYNQHAYSITNVSDDGTIPKKVRDNWTTQGLNNFRLNVQPGATYLPDLEIKDISSPYDCTPPIPIYFNVVNVGWATAPAGITIHVWASDKDSDYKEIGTVKTDQKISANGTISLKYDYTPETSDALYLQFTFGDDAPVECNSGNNSATYKIVCPVN